MLKPVPPVDPAAPTPKLTAGCIMLLVVGGWLVALAGWMLWHLSGQLKDMRNFTEPTAQAIHPIRPTGVELETLRARLNEFADKVEAKTAASLDLSVADLNHLVAAQEPVSRLQDIAKVEEITDSIRLKVALALNGMPFSGDRLYLNGFINVRPEVKADSGIVLLTRSLEVPGKTLSDGFNQRYLEANHMDGLAFDELRKDNRINGILSKITSTRCEPGKVVVEYTPPPARTGPPAL